MPGAESQSYAATYGHNLARYPGRIVGGEEISGLGDVFRLAGAAQRRAVHGILCERIVFSGLVRWHTLGFGESWGERLHADLARPQLQCQRTAGPIHVALRSRIPRH